MDIQDPAEAGLRIFPVLAGRKNQMSSKLAFPQFALLEQNLQISYYVRDSCESQTQYKMPAYSVVKDLCVLTSIGPLPLLAERSLAFFSKERETIKNPASSAGPSRPNTPGRVRAMLDYLLP